MSRRFFASIVTLVVVIMVTPGAVLAGEIVLEWDPVSHPDLVGYRVHYGQTPETLDGTLDIGDVTTVALTGLADCTTWYVGMTARGSDGSESPVMSSILGGWPRPVVAAASPSVLERGSTVDVLLDGANFQPGATVEFGAGVSVTAVTPIGCQQLVATVAIAPDATVGPRTVAVVNPDAVFGETPSLVEVVVVNDGEPPVLSVAELIDVTWTSATIGWTTDEPADASIAYRESGASSWVDGPVDATLQTSHELTLTGLTPETTYEFTVTSADEAGNTATSSPATFTTAASPYDYLRFEAESPAPVAPLEVVTGGDGFRGGWLEVESGTPVGSPGDPAGEQVLGVTLPRAATWRVWLRMHRHPSSSGEWFVALDGGAYQAVAPAERNVWSWVEATSGTLSAGRHTVRLGGGDTGARADRVIVTDDPDFVPSESPGADTSPPPGVTAAVADAGDAQVTLTWTDPASPDAERVIVRFLAGGDAPTGPVDGEPLFDGVVDPAAARELLHAPLANDEQVSYSIFVVDPSDNASDPVTVTATPQAPPPPLGTVLNLRRADTVGGD